MKPSYLEKEHILRIVQNSGNDEQYTTKGAVELLLPHIHHLRDKTIWCPFDTEDSQFVKVLRENGYRVVYSHIWNGQDFFEYEPKQWDIILSNPPYSKKKEIIKRLNDFCKPWSLLMPLNYIGAKGIYEVVDDIHKLQLFIPYKRMRFNLYNKEAVYRRNPIYKAVYFGIDFFKNSLILESPSTQNKYLGGF